MLYSIIFKTNTIFINIICIQLFLFITYDNIVQAKAKLYPNAEFVPHGKIVDNRFYLSQTDESGKEFMSSNKKPFFLVVVFLLRNNVMVTTIENRVSIFKVSNNLNETASAFKHFQICVQFIFTLKG